MSSQEPSHQTNTTSSDGSDDKKKWYLLIDNPSKSNHLGTYLRCAAAFQCHQVLLVGYDKFNCQGSFGANLYLDIVAFHSWDRVFRYVRGGCVENEPEAQAMDGSAAIVDERHDNQHISIIGILGAFGGGEELFSSKGVSVYEHPETGFVSLTPAMEQTLPQQPGEDNIQQLPFKSYPVHHRPFSTHVCFLLSKDKRGLTIDKARMCDGFVHVPHLDIFDVDDGGCSVPVPTATPPLPKETVDTQHQTQQLQPMVFVKPASLLDTATVFSIVLHHFTECSGYVERQFNANQKFAKDERPSRVRYLGVGKSHKEKDDCKAVDDVTAQEEQDAAMMMWKSKGEEAVNDGDY